MTIQLLNPSPDHLIENHIDVTVVDVVQVETDGRTIWVNVNGICLLRICRFGHLEINMPSKREWSRSKINMLRQRLTDLKLALDNEQISHSTYNLNYKETVEELEHEIEKWNTP